MHLARRNRGVVRDRQTTIAPVTNQKFSALVVARRQESRRHCQIRTSAVDADQAIRVRTVGNCHATGLITACVDQNCRAGSDAQFACLDRALPRTSTGNCERCLIAKDVDRPTLTEAEFAQPAFADNQASLTGRLIANCTVLPDNQVRAFADYLAETF